MNRLRLLTMACLLVALGTTTVLFAEDAEEDPIRQHARIKPDEAKLREFVADDLEVVEAGSLEDEE